MSMAAIVILPEPVRQAASCQAAQNSHILPCVTQSLKPGTNWVPGGLLRGELNDDADI
jgi:hypothetical protein